MKSLKFSCTRLLGTLLFLTFLLPTLGAADPLAQYNVVWKTPSQNSTGTMPLGNGDIGLNLWVQADGDLLFYVSKTDAWDEHARLLKLGRVRVHLSPNPFAAEMPFRQTLRLRQGEIRIQAGPPGAQDTLDVWVDANRPVIHVEARGERPFGLAAHLEDWRTKKRALGPEEGGGVDPFQKGQPVYSYPDTIVTDAPDCVLWFHRNDVSLWPYTLSHQGLSQLTNRFTDPLLHRTFGAEMKGDGLRRVSSTALQSVQPRRHFVLSIYPLTAQTPTVAAWRAKLDRSVAAVDAVPLAQARVEHRRWWNAFWNRSWIRVTGSRNAGHLSAKVVTEGYTLQRFIDACGGRGAMPIKFNGSIFTVDVIGKFNADYRRWGGCYWFQNTRLIYWPLLASGDFDLMRPLFRMYRAALPFAEARTPIYFGHPGAFFPETMYFWGAYHNGGFGYGWNRKGVPFGITENRYIRYYWQGGLELTAMMLDYYHFTEDRRFAKQTLLPLATQVLEFYARHYPRNADGQLVLKPSQSLETWWDCVNPMPDIAGMKSDLDRLLALPRDLVPAAQHAAWQRLRAAVPPLPLRKVDGQTILAPAEKYASEHNAENPELYAVFPYRLFGVGKPELAMARATFAHRQFKGNHGWQQDDTQAAFLGLAEQARARVSSRFADKNPASRFPAFWGPNFDWIPDQDHGSNGLMALETMLLQWDGHRLFVLPAWPKEWDVEFKLHAPYHTVVEGVYRHGKLEQLKVTPKSRMKDVVICQPGTGTEGAGHH